MERSTRARGRQGDRADAPTYSYGCQRHETRRVALRHGQASIEEQCGQQVPR